MAFYVPYFVGLSMISYVSNSIYNLSQNDDTPLQLDELPIIIDSTSLTDIADLNDSINILIEPNGMLLCIKCNEKLTKKMQQ